MQFSHVFSDFCWVSLWLLEDVDLEPHVDSTGDTCSKEQGHLSGLPGWLEKTSWDERLQQEWWAELSRKDPSAKGAPFQVKSGRMHGRKVRIHMFLVTNPTTAVSPSEGGIRSGRAPSHSPIIGGPLEPTSQGQGLTSVCLTCSATGPWSALFPRPLWPVLP